MNHDQANIQRNYLLLRWLGRIWALPNTLIGILLGCLGANTWQFHRGTLEILLRNGPVLWSCRRLCISAFTLGDCVLYAVPPCENLRVHEGRHTRQYWILGPLFLPAYFSLLAVYGYYGHPLERDARVWELNQCGCLYQGGLAKSGTSRTGSESA